MKWKIRANHDLLEDKSMSNLCIREISGKEFFKMCLALGIESPPFLCDFLRQGLAQLPRLSLDWGSSCLSLLSNWYIGVHHHTWLEKLLKWSWGRHQSNNSGKYSWVNIHVSKLKGAPTFQKWWINRNPYKCTSSQSFIYTGYGESEEFYTWSPRYWGTVEWGFPCV